jgi:hypothetical protein
LLYVVDCCWAIVAMECLASAIKIKNPNQLLKTLSVKQLINECRHRASNVYPYNNKDAALHYIKENGILEQHNYMDVGYVVAQPNLN